MASISMPRPKRALLLILLLALALRLAHGLGQDHEAVYRDPGGDSSWYLVNGYALSSGFDQGDLEGFGEVGSIPVELRHLPTPPLYLLFVGLPQLILPQAGAVILIRVLQALLGAATVYFAYRLTVLIARDPRVGLLTAAVLAIHPAFVIEAAQITTETLYIALMTAGLILYVERVIAPHLRSNIRRLDGRTQPLRILLPVALVAVLLGLATLTRAALLLFPLGLAIHLLLVYRRRSAAAILVLLGVYTLVVGSWTAYNLLRWDRMVIGGEGFAAFLYIGATEEGWQGPDAVDQSLPETDDNPYLEGAGAIISSDPLGYLMRRASRLTEAQLQPHGTLYYRGPSLRDLLANWLGEDRSIAGLDTLIQAESFWPKLSLYLLQFLAYGAGLVGMWRARRRWPLTLPLIGFIVYTALLHLLLEALPRYIFPTLVFWWVFAGVAFMDSNGRASTAI